MENNSTRLTYKFQSFNYDHVLSDFYLRFKYLYKKSDARLKIDSLASCKTPQQFDVVLKHLQKALDIRHSRHKSHLQAKKKLDTIFNLDIPIDSVKEFFKGKKPRNYILAERSMVKAPFGKIPLGKPLRIRRKSFRYLIDNKIVACKYYQVGIPYVYELTIKIPEWESYN